MLQQLLSLSPATGEEVQWWPIALGVVAVLVIVVLAVLPLFKKKK